MFIAGHHVAPSLLPTRAVLLHERSIPAPASDFGATALALLVSLGLWVELNAKMPVKTSLRGLPTLYCRAVLNTQTGTLDRSRVARCKERLRWVQAAWAAIQVYLELHQKPTHLSHGDDDLANQNLSPEELKKLKLKRKKVTCSLLPDTVRVVTRLQAHHKLWPNWQICS